MLMLHEFYVYRFKLMEEYSIDGQDVSQSPRTQQKQPGEQPPIDKVETLTSDDQTSYPQTSEPEIEKTDSQGCRRFFSLSFYEEWFQVSQEEVLDRIKQNFIPFKREFIEKLDNKPDFYGPFWILTTIIFLLGSTGNLARYFYNWQKDAYIFKLELVRYGVVLVYSLGFGVPALLYAVLHFLKCDTLDLPKLICIYGYSFGCFILVFLLCVIPVPWLHWLLMIYGMVNSIAFLVLNLRDYLQALENKSFIVFGIIGGAQIFLFLMFKLVFFDLIYQTQE